MPILCAVLLSCSLISTTFFYKPIKDIKDIKDRTEQGENQTTLKKKFRHLQIEAYHGMIVYEVLIAPP